MPTSQLFQAKLRVLQDAGYHVDAMISWNGKRLCILFEGPARVRFSAEEVRRKIHVGMSIAPPLCADQVDRLLAVSEQWHMNDLHPECEHQRDLGWDKIARRSIIRLTYKLATLFLDQQLDLKEKLFAGEHLTESERWLALSAYERYVYVGTEQEVQIVDQLMLQFDGMRVPSPHHYRESKTLGSLREDQHPAGLLGRPCPACGHKYGSSWQTLPVPDDVLDFLRRLVAVGG